VLKKTKEILGSVGHTGVMQSQYRSIGAKLANTSDKKSLWDVLVYFTKHIRIRKFLIKRSYHLGIRDVTARQHGIETAKVDIRPTGNWKSARKKNSRQFFFFFSSKWKKKCCRVGVKK
jgi:hypothetical protein